MGGAVFRIDVLQNGKTISCGLTSASLCQSDDVAMTLAFGRYFGVEVGIGGYLCDDFGAFFGSLCDIGTFC